ncbi:MAG TPA: NAD(P)-dependent oxidoreductase [Stellaceae bacterium]|nr:NAD(P)-dependent oxidoreductase [Stellaceae bacterium]
MRIAVTGGRGRLGRYVVAELMKRHEVRVLDKSAPTEAGAYAAVDVLDRAALAAAFKGQEVVAHLAAIDRSVPCPDDVLFDINVRGTWNVFDAAESAGVRRVIHCSSSSVYGLDDTNPEMPPLYLPVDEAHPTRPSATYGMSKRAGEVIAAAFARRRQLEVLIIRPCYVAFPEMIPFLMGGGPVKGREGEAPPYLRPYVDPADVAGAFALAAEHSYAGIETLNICAGDSCTDVPTVDHLRNLYGSVPPLSQPGLYGENPRAGIFGIAKAKAVLGWEPTTSWAEMRQRAS